MCCRVAVASGTASSSLAMRLEDTIAAVEQRLLLEQTYLTYAEAGFDKANLLGRDVGVFLGIMNTDFAELTQGSTSVYAATGGTISVAAGRL
eukprot:7258887-Prymnesium_polylepis.1